MVSMSFPKTELEKQPDEKLAATLSNRIEFCGTGIMFKD